MIGRYTKPLYGWIVCKTDQLVGALFQQDNLPRVGISIDGGLSLLVFGRSHYGQFELGFLTGTEPRTLEETLESVDLVRAKGPSTVLVTSVDRPDAPAGTIEMLAVNDEGAWLVQTPRLDSHPSGSGDVTAALFASALVETGSAPQALARTAASIFDLLEATYDAGSSELLLIEAQEAFVNPKRSFDVTQVR